LPSPIDNYIAPENLLGLVRNTAPFLTPRLMAEPRLESPRLIALGSSPHAYLEVLANGEDLTSRALADQELIEDYFAFCLACHHTTVATFVPTDVDAKIRGLLWRHRDGESLRRMFEFTLRWLNWSIDGISARATELARVGPVSGHNGEQLSVLAGALGAFLKTGDAEYAERASDAIHGELQREADEFQFALDHKGCELDALRISATLTHNVGDLDQGISFWPTAASHDVARKRFARLAHENTSPYQGVFQRAARIYKKAMSCEGHRNYPLRPVKSLRQSPDLLLPLGPFLDDWGAMVAVHSALTWQDRADVLAALVHGCRTIAGQRGYFRALHGMAGALQGNLERVIQLTGNRTRADWKDADLRRQVAVPRISFESMMKKML
jgi:hypothetical protein